MNRQRPILRLMRPGTHPAMHRALAGMSAGGLLLSAAGAAISQTIPATPPTSRGGVMSTTAPIAARASGANTAERHRARVSYHDGLLEVRADNSSLNQILRDISRQTGMSIVGGVADQRVFGTYGPAPAVSVLKTLLDGTGANMLLKETATRAPEQLILSPQSGGAAPPGPNSAGFDVTETEPEMPAPGQPGRPAAARQRAELPVPGSPNVPPPGTALGPPQPGSLYPTMPAPMNNPNGSPNNVSPTASTLPVTNSVPTDSLPVPSTAQPATGIVDAPNPPPVGSTTEGFTGATAPDNNPNNPPQSSTGNPAGTTPPQSPNGVKTPQQVYEQLRQLEQQKQQQGGTTQTPAPQGSTTPQP